MRKRRKAKQKQGTCVYCGKHGPITKDHVPPKSFFGDKLPQGINLITVPCCEGCRRRYEKLDEKLKVLLTTVADPDENPVVRELWDDEGSIVRGAKRPEAEGFRRGMLETIFPVELQTKSGLYAGRTGGFRLGDVDIPEFVARTVRALYFHEHSGPLPGDHAVWFAGTPVLLLSTYPDEPRQVIVATMRQSLRVVHPHVFKYAHVAAHDAPASTMWFVRFFNAAEFAATTNPRSFLQSLKGLKVL